MVKYCLMGVGDGHGCGDGQSILSRYVCECAGTAECEW